MEKLQIKKLQPKKKSQTNKTENGGDETLTNSTEEPDKTATSALSTAAEESSTHHLANVEKFSTVVEESSTHHLANVEEFSTVVEESSTHHLANVEKFSTVVEESSTHHLANVEEFSTVVEESSTHHLATDEESAKSETLKDESRSIVDVTNAAQIQPATISNYKRFKNYVSNKATSFSNRVSDGATSVYNTVIGKFDLKFEPEISAFDDEGQCSITITTNCSESLDVVLDVVRDEFKYVCSFPGRQEKELKKEDKTFNVHGTSVLQRTDTVLSVSRKNDNSPTSITLTFSAQRARADDLLHIFLRRNKTCKANYNIGF